MTLCGRLCGLVPLFLVLPGVQVYFKELTWEKKAFQPNFQFDPTLNRKPPLLFGTVVVQSHGKPPLSPVNPRSPPCSTKHVPPLCCSNINNYTARSHYIPIYSFSSRSCSSGGALRGKQRDSRLVICSLCFRIDWQETQPPLVHTDTF